MFLPYASKTPFYNFPIVTVVIVCLNVLVYIYEVYLIFTGDIKGFINTFAYDPENVRIYSLWTSTFLHADIFHILGNLWMFALVAINLEDKMGRLKFSVFYFLSAPFSNIVYSLVNHHPVVGMSGCVFACIGAFFVILPWGEFKVLYFIILFVKVYTGTFAIPAIMLFGFYIATQLYHGISNMGVSGVGVQVAYWGHIGGIIFGVGWAWAFYGFKAFTEDEGRKADKLKVKIAKKKIDGDKEVIEHEEAELDFDRPPASIEEGEKRLDIALFRKDSFLLEKTFNEMIVLFPNFNISPGVLFESSVLLKKHGRFDLALIGFEKIIHNHPDIPIVTQSLLFAGEIAAKSQNTIDKAIIYLEDFLKRDVPLIDALEAKKMLKDLYQNIPVTQAEPEQQEETITISEDSHAPDGLIGIPKVAKIHSDKLSNLPLKGFGALKRETEIERNEQVSENSKTKTSEPEEYIQMEHPIDDHFSEIFSKNVDKNTLMKEEDFNLEDTSNEKYNVILQKNSPINLNAIKLVLSKALRIDENTVERRIKKGKGIILNDISLEIATKLRGALASYGQKTTIVKETSNTVFNKTEEIDSLIISDNNLQLDNEKGSHKIFWDKIIFLCMAGIADDRAKTLPQRLVDIFTIEPNIHFRIWDRNLKDAKILPLNPILSLNFIPIVEELLNRSLSAKKSMAFTNFFQGKNLMPKSFSSTQEYDNFIKWEMLSLFGEEII